MSTALKDVQMCATCDLSQADIRYDFFAFLWAEPQNLLIAPCIHTAS